MRNNRGMAIAVLGFVLVAGVLLVSAFAMARRAHQSRQGTGTADGGYGGWAYTDAGAGSGDSSGDCDSSAGDAGCDGGGGDGGGGGD